MMGDVQGQVGAQQDKFKKKVSYARNQWHGQHLYSRFQVTFQSPVAKFILNIPNYITKFGILRGNLLS